MPWHMVCVTYLVCALHSARNRDLSLAFQPCALYTLHGTVAYKRTWSAEQTALKGSGVGSTVRFGEVMHDLI
eukprot:scaffold93705_cov19-Tisochrysis_lutea.AAC.3